MAVVDQMDVAAGTICEVSGIPFVNFSCGVPVYLDDRNPAPYFEWAPAACHCQRRRNHRSNQVIERLLQPVRELVNGARCAWGLKEFRRVNDMFSPNAIVTQLPRVLEFKGATEAGPIVYAGQLRDSHPRKSVSFPWDRLTGKPLIYASMGTIRNNDRLMFQTILDACAAATLQLVLSLGAGSVRPADLEITGDAVVVDYAPQIDLVRRSGLVISCAGLNTTLDCVSEGVPVVAIPVAEDQPGIAARIREAGMGVIVPARRLTTSRLRAAVMTVLDDPSYRWSARQLQAAAARVDGADVAAQEIERALGRA